jgi:hypothetical protein
MFNVVNHRRQVIATGRLSTDAMAKYAEAKTTKKDVVFTIHTKSAALRDLKTLDEILDDKKFIGDIYEGLPDIYGLVAPDLIVCIYLLTVLFRM